MILKRPMDDHVKKEAFRSLTAVQPEKALKVLSLFKENEIEKAILCWQGFFLGISEVNSKKPEDRKARDKYFLESLKKINDFNDDFIKQILWPLVDAWNDIAGPIYHSTDKEYFKKWWNRLWRLSITKCNLSNKESGIVTRAHDEPASILTRSIFSLLWSLFPNKIPRNKKIPEDVQYYFRLIIKDAKKCSFVSWYFGQALYALWFLDRTWTNHNIKPLMDWDKHQNICKAVWDGYTYNMNLSPDFLSDFKSEFFQLFLNKKKFYEKELQSRDEIKDYESLADLFFITTGGKWYNNIFTNQETEQLRSALNINITPNINILESLSRKIWQSLKDSEDKSDVLWSEKIEPWMTTFWPPQIDMKTPVIAQNLSCALLYCGDKFPVALDFLEEHIKPVIQRNHYLILYGINEESEDKANNISKVFNHPEDLLKLLSWNLPQNNLYYYHSDLRKVLDKIKKKKPEIENDEQYRKLLEQSKA